MKAEDHSTSGAKGNAIEKLFQAQSVAKLTEAFAQENIDDGAGLDVRNACDVIYGLIEEALNELNPPGDTA